MSAPPWSEATHVVTANKGPAAFAYRELRAWHGKTMCVSFLKARSWTAPRFSTCSGRRLRGCRVTGFSGILNTTTNFVISRLEKGESMDSAIQTAQDWALPKPILPWTWKAGTRRQKPPSWPTSSWTRASPLCRWSAGASRDLTSATPPGAGQGRRLKLICRAGVKMVTCGPKWGRKRSPRTIFFAVVSGKGAALRLETDMMGPFWIIQENPGLNDTAAGVLFDLLTVAASRKGDEQCI